ncbi:hypothetical protein EMCRGX_G032407 [Ephydatia muelleri]
MVFGARLTWKGCNIVHNDEIWKDHVRRELMMQRKWPHVWGFLASQNEYKIQTTVAAVQRYSHHHGTTAGMVGVRWSVANAQRIKAWTDRTHYRSSTEKTFKWPKECAM